MGKPPTPTMCFRKLRLHPMTRSPPTVTTSTPPAWLAMPATLWRCVGHGLSNRRVPSWHSGLDGARRRIVANNPIQPPPTCRNWTVPRLVCNLTAPGDNRAASFRHGSPALLYTGNSRDMGIAPGPLPTWKSATIARPRPRTGRCGRLDASRGCRAVKPRWGAVRGWLASGLRTLNLIVRIGWSAPPPCGPPPIKTTSTPPAWLAMPAHIPAPAPYRPLWWPRRYCAAGA